MKRTGAHHLGLATYDYDGIVEFYTRVLGWAIAWQEVMSGPDGTVHMKHVFFDTGDGSYVSFMCPTADMPNFPTTWATDINSGLGVMNGAYHFAFWAESVEELEEKQARLRQYNHPVTEIIDHEWSKSIYFRAPDGLQLEFRAEAFNVTNHVNYANPDPRQSFFAGTSPNDPVVASGTFSPRTKTPSRQLQFGLRLSF